MARTIVSFLGLVLLLCTGLWLVGQIESAAGENTYTGDGVVHAAPDADHEASAVLASFPRDTRRSPTEFRITGLVSRADNYVAEQQVSAWVEGQVRTCASAQSDRLGHFTMTLPGPGSYVFSVGATLETRVTFEPRTIARDDPFVALELE